MGGLGLAHLRQDGFAAMEPVGVGGAGTVITRPLECVGSVLRVSADAIGGAVRAAVLGVDGLALGDCEPITGNVTDGIVTWRGGRDLLALIGQRVRLCFELQSARLYAFGFAG